MKFSILIISFCLYAIFSLEQNIQNKLLQEKMLQIFSKDNQDIETGIKEVNELIQKMISALQNDLQKQLQDNSDDENCINEEILIQQQLLEEQQNNIYKFEAQKLIQTEMIESNDTNIQDYQKMFDSQKENCDETIQKKQSKVDGLENGITEYDDLIRLLKQALEQMPTTTYMLQENKSWSQNLSSIKQKLMDFDRLDTKKVLPLSFLVQTLSKNQQFNDDINSLNKVITDLINLLLKLQEQEQLVIDNTKNSNEKYAKECQKNQNQLTNQIDLFEQIQKNQKGVFDFQEKQIRKVNKLKEEYEDQITELNDLKEELNKQKTNFQTSYDSQLEILKQASKVLVETIE